MTPSSTDPAALSRMPLFQRVPARELERLAPLLQERSFPAGANVITAEQTGETVYVILKGSVKVYLTHTTAARSS